VAGDDLTVGTHHTDEGAVQLFRGVAQGIEQAAVWGALRAFFNVIIGLKDTKTGYYPREWFS